MNSRASSTSLIVLGAVALGAMAWMFLYPGSPASVGGLLARRAADNERAAAAAAAAAAAERAAERPGALAAAVPGAPRVPQEGQVLVVRTARALPIDDPLAREWDQAPATAVPLQVQDQTAPVLDQLSVKEVSVQGLTDGRQVAFLVSWKDPSADMNVDSGRFSDAAAVQLAVDANAAYTMGVEGMKVEIIYWKALWQKDLDEHFQDVQDLHPNYWSDLYWFAEGEFPYPVPVAFQKPESRLWFVAWQAGNPMADFERAQPVEELVAEGFGTLTHQPESASTARGVWREGRWSVVFARPLSTNDPLDYQFRPGEPDVVAFAVWDGSSGNVGARHQQSLWVVFEVEP